MAENKLIRSESVGKESQVKDIIDPFGDTKTTSIKVATLTVCYDGDKIRGIQWKCSDKSEYGIGETQYGDHATATFLPAEHLTKLILRASLYAGGALRQIELDTARYDGMSTSATTANFKAGPDPDGNSTMVVVDVGSDQQDQFLRGFKVWSAGSYLQAIAAFIQPDPPL